MEKKLIAYVIVLLLSGSATTILTKYSNLLSSEGKDGDVHKFRHPFLQTWGLSVGEFACIIISLLWDCWKGRRDDKNHIEDESKKEQNSAQVTDQVKDEPPNINPFIFLPSAIFHQSSRCLIFLSLIFTTASSYQMLSGSNIIFACVFGRIFLKKSLPWHKWIGVSIIVVGVVGVGVSDFLFTKEDDGLNPLLGDVFALSAMVLWAAQLTYEEKFVKKYKMKPIHALGLKGVFSLVIMTFLLIGFYFLKVPFDMGQPNGVMEDAIDGFIQLGNNYKLLISYLFTTLALTISALAGIGVMRQLSAVHVVVFNTFRSVIVWIFSLAIAWQIFQPLQLIGFIFIILGVIVFNDIVIGPFLRRHFANNKNYTVNE